MIRTPIKYLVIFIRAKGKKNLQSKIANLKSKNKKWRREQDSNLQALTGGSFQDYCITNYAISPQNLMPLTPKKILNAIQRVAHTAKHIIFIQNCFVICS